jgi:REP element-mobilizing transposase RayT
MPHVKVWIHFVWTTKNRHPFLTDTIRQKVFQHIRENARDKGIFLDHINGYREHVHCLISLGIEQTISWVVKMLKGESSHWINEQGLCPGKFQWQHEYFAVGVSESVVERVRLYIRKQEDHHLKQSFDVEFDQMINKFRFKRLMDDDA